MNAKVLRIVYMGTPDFAVTPLKALVEGGYNVVAVITSPDKPAGRGLKLSESAVKKYAQSVGINVLQPERLKNEQFIEQFRELDADLGVVIAFRMLPEVIWSMPRLGTFNLHASLLPQYRGAAPINWAIINGETVSGVTTFMLNSEIDKGDILFQSEVPIAPDETVGEIHDRLMYLGRDLVLETVDAIAHGDIQPIEQHTITGELRGAPKLFKENTRIDWSMAPEKIHNLIRGLSPYPCAWSMLGDLNVKITKASYILEPHELSSGTIVSDDKNYIRVATSNTGFIIIERLQISGKKEMSVSDLLRGFRISQYGRFE